MPPTARSADPRFHDFDADFAEQSTIPFKVLGKVWELPGSVPAATLLRLQRLMLVVASTKDGDDLPDDFVLDESLSVESMLRQMVGDQILDEWLAKGIKYDMMMAVSQRLYAIHTGSEVPGGDAGKAPAVSQPADRKPPASTSPRKRSSSTGR